MTFYKPAAGIGLRKEYDGAEDGITLERYLENQRENGAFDPDAVIYILAHDNRFYYLNATAGLVFALAVNGKDDSEIAQRIVALFDVERDRAARDVAAALSDLVDKGLLLRK